MTCLFITAILTLQLTVLCSKAKALPCSLPTYLWRNELVGDTDMERVVGETGTRRTWITEEKHIANSNNYESRKLIVARETELLLSNQMMYQCENEPCVRTELAVRLECMQSEGGEKFRFKRFMNGFEDIICFRFLQRTNNIVQVFTSRPSDTNLSNLCNDLHRQDWPWLAETTERSSFPLHGGYELVANLTYIKKRICERIWKSQSRLDMQCMAGEGFQFSFPESHCSIFASKQKEPPPLTTAECDFPSSYHGNWMTFEGDRLVPVDIRSGSIESPVYGTLLCKNKNAEQEQYTFVSVFKNGCSARFVCIQFRFEEKEKLLKMRISATSREDESSKLCNFEHNTHSIGRPDDTVTNHQDYKTLIARSLSHQHSCGLGGLVHLVLKFNNDQMLSTCEGSLSDWNPFTCTISSTLALSYRNCYHNRTLVHREFTCDSYVDLNDKTRVINLHEVQPETGLITRSCFLVKLNSSLQRQYWGSAEMYKKANCRLQIVADTALKQQAEISFQIKSEVAQKQCIIMTKNAKTVRGGAGGIRYSVRKNARDNKYTSSKQRITALRNGSFFYYDQATSTAVTPTAARRLTSIVNEDILLLSIVHILYLRV